MLCCGNYQTETLVPAATSWAEARQLGELALKIAREIGQRSGEAYALRAIGQCLGFRGEYTQALGLAQDGLRVAEEIGHRQWMAAGHWVLGALYLDLLVLPTAQQHLEQAVALAQEIGSLFWIRITTGFLAMVHMLQHDLAQAESLAHALRLILILLPKRSGSGSSGMHVQSSHSPATIHILPCTSPINFSHPPASRVSLAFPACRNCVGRYSPN